MTHWRDPWEPTLSLAWREDGFSLAAKRGIGRFSRPHDFRRCRVLVVERDSTSLEYQPLCFSHSTLGEVFHASGHVRYADLIDGEGNFNLPVRHRFLSRQEVLTQSVYSRHCSNSRELLLTQARIFVPNLYGALHLLHLRFTWQSIC